jgi:hypothetical protein
MCADFSTSLCKLRGTGDIHAIDPGRFLSLFFAVRLSGRLLADAPDPLTRSYVNRQLLPIQ